MKVALAGVALICCLAWPRVATASSSQFLQEQQPSSGAVVEFLDCPTEALVDLTGLEAAADGSIEAHGLRFPQAAQYRDQAKVFGCPCRERACLSLCCDDEKVCSARRPNVPKLTSPTTKSFPAVHDAETGALRVGLGPEAFWLLSWNPCQYERYELEPDKIAEERYELRSDGSIFLPLNNSKRNFTQYCLNEGSQGYSVQVCFEEPFSDAEDSEPAYTPLAPWGMISSVPFLLATFFVYLLLPELRNIHGLTITAYVFCLIVSNTSLSTLQITPPECISMLGCYIFAYIVHFFFLASFFWLNVMCFDIWWTFGGFRSLHGSVKQREHKKFMMYSIYAWGCASLLTGLCLIMDLTPGIPNDIIKPNFGQQTCWFASNDAKAIYFYGPMGVTVVCNIFLFIMTAIKILRHKKDTARHLKGSDSRRHDDNKQWFNLYLKLFIVMGINWSMEIVSWLLAKRTPEYIFYLTDLVNSLQGVVIFIIFVWKEKIKQLLLKRFGCEGKWLSRNSTGQSGNPQMTNSSSRNTCTTMTTVPVPEKSVHEKISSVIETTENV
ncbi:hypothetical protein TKK_0002613 [Trichogramma kaykai]